VPKISLFYYDTLDGGRTFPRSLRLSLHAGRMYAKVMVQKINLTLSSSTPKFFLPACFSASPPPPPPQPASLPACLPACRRACMHGPCMSACVRARACGGACVRACVYVHGCVRARVCGGRWVGGRACVWPCGLVVGGRVGARARVRARAGAHRAPTR
jgi:hypothetical protein